MNKGVISILGTDRPGIVAAVSKSLFHNRCNIEDVSQTLLQTEFAGVVIVSLPDDLKLEDLKTALEKDLAPAGLSILIKPLEAAVAMPQAARSQPFIVTTMGGDRLGLIAGISEVMAAFGANIVNLKAIFRGGENPMRNTMIYEVDVPPDIDQKAFREALRQRAESLGLTLSLQHRNIFDALHHI